LSESNHVSGEQLSAIRDALRGVKESTDAIRVGLDNVTSRITLIEQRLTMLESSVDGGGDDSVHPPTLDKLEESLGANINLLKYEEQGEVVKPLRFLGDCWSEIDQKLTAWGYRWVRRDKCWRFQADDKQGTQATEGAPHGAPNKVYEVGSFTDIAGEVIDKPSARDVELRDGNIVTVCSFKMRTRGGNVVRVSTWDKLAYDVLDRVTQGSHISLSNMMVKTPFDNMTQLSSTRRTKLTVLEATQ